MASPGCSAPTSRGALIRQNSDEQLLFAPCLDNVRKCFLVLKSVYMPLLVLNGCVMAVLNVMWLFGAVANFSNVSSFAMFVHVIIIGIPTILVPPLVRMRLIPPVVRLAIANVLFLAVCLLVPVINAHRVWRRQYQELNGLLYIYEFMPSAPPRVRPSAVLPHETLSVCDDDLFLSLFVFDHASMSLSMFVLWNFIELPRSVFVPGFSLHIFHFWASAHRITGIHADTCSGRPKVGGFPDADAIRLQMQPILHMVHMMSITLYLFTKAFISSRNRKENQKWAKSAIEEAISCSKVHAQALIRLIIAHQPQKPQQTGFFWSRTELIQRQAEEHEPFIVPASVGSALKICATLNDWAIYVGVLGLPIQLSFFELMRLVIRVDAAVGRAIYAYILKSALLFGLLALPHAIFSKAMLRRRVWAPWIVFLSCLLVAIVGEQILRPGILGNQFLPKNIRFYVCFVLMISMPSSILRAFSRDASTKLVFLAFFVQIGLGLYNIYREFLLAHAVDAGDSAAGNAPRFDAGWCLILFFQFVLEFGMLCVCILLDKKQHGVHTGRKFFLAERSSAPKRA